MLYIVDFDDTLFYTGDLLREAYNQATEKVTGQRNLITHERWSKNIGNSFEHLINGLGFDRKIHAEYSLENNIRFTGGIFDSSILNNLRHFSLGLFHGHSVGGTNPSLLEAMASGANIIAHENTYNRHILGGNARYFYSREDIINILVQTHGSDDLIKARTRNVEKIRAEYQWKTVTDSYEKLFIQLMENSKLSSGI